LKTVANFRSELERFLSSFDQTESTDENVVFCDFLVEARKYFKRGSEGNHFEDPLRQFCEYIYLKGGLSVYTSIYLNSPIPSPSTLKFGMQKERIDSSKIYVKELKSFLKEFDQPLEVIISEDATRITSRIELDPRTNELVGLLAPLNPNTGMPFENYFKATKPSKILDFVANYKQAPYLQTIVAKPMKLGILN